MTISTNDLREEYTATASQTVFSFDFRVFADTDVTVYQTASGSAFNDASDIITAYTVSRNANQDSSPGGSITLDSGATVGDRITIVSAIPESRTTDYQVGGAFDPDTVDDDMDRILSVAKQASAKAGRAMLAPASEQNAGDLALPDSSARSDKLLGFNSSGDPEAVAYTQSTVTSTDVRNLLGDNVRTFSLSYTSGSGGITSSSVNTTFDTTLVAGDVIETTHYDSNKTAGSGAKWQFTGTTTLAKAGTVNADGFVYDSIGKQYQNAELEPSVSHWGALGDGSTDDTTAIQSAITSAAPKIRLIGGATSMVAGLTAVANQIIEGDGETTILKLASGSDDDVIYGTGIDGVQLLNFKIDGNQAGQTSNNKQGIYLDTCDNHLIEGVTITDVEKHGILLDDCNNSIVRGNTIDSISDGTNIGHAIVLTDSAGTSYYNTITQNKINNCPKGILLEGSSTLRNTVSENNIVSITNGYGIFPFSGAGYNRIIGNYVRQCIWEGIENHTSDFNLIEGNTCVANGFNGIEVFQSNNCTVQGNVCTDNGTGGNFAGIRISAESASTFARFNTVVGNVCTDSGAADQYNGIDDFESGGGLVDVNIYVGNVCRNNTNDQLVPSGANDTVRANTVSSEGSFASLDSVSDVSGGELQMKIGMENIALAASGTITTLPTGFPNGYTVVFKIAASVTFKDVSTTGNMQCPGNVDLVTNSNDVVSFSWWGTNWHCNYYTNV